jgi:hypothetical protein
VEIRVKLPADTLIEYQAFCRAIAEAVSPTGEAGLEGIECVRLKFVTFPISIPPSNAPITSPYYQAWQSVLVSEDGRTLEGLIPTDLTPSVADGELDLQPRGPSFPLIAEVTLPFELTDADRRHLAEVLPELPRLRYPMSEEERADFTEAYLRMPIRPPFALGLITDETIRRRKAYHQADQESHRKALLREFKAGRITPVNSAHFPVETLTVGTFITRAQALLYLERCGLAYIDDTASLEAVNVAASDESRLGATARESDMSTTETGVRRIGEPRFRQSEKEAAVKLYWELKKAHEPRFVKRVAEKYGVSERTISGWVNKFGGPNSWNLNLFPTSVFNVSTNK